MPLTEPNFFFKHSEFLKGEDYYWDKYFVQSSSHKILGEKSSSCLYGSEKCASRIKDYNSGIKLIIILRNPLERAYSNYLFTVKNGIEFMNFDYALNSESERIKNMIGKWKEIQPYAYMGRSDYMQQVKSYFKYFPIEQISINFFEDFIGDPIKFTDDICNFLGISNNHNFDFSHKERNANFNKFDFSLPSSLEILFEKNLNYFSNLMDRDISEIWRYKV